MNLTRPLIDAKLRWPCGRCGKSQGRVYADRGNQLVVRCAGCDKYNYSMPHKHFEQLRARAVPEKRACVRSPTRKAFTPAEAAQVLAVEERVVLGLIESGRLPSIRIGVELRVTKAALDDVLSGKIELG